MKQQAGSWSLIYKITALIAPCFLFLGCEEVWKLLRDDRRPDRYLIPEHFVGWVRIDYKVEGAPELPIEDGFYVHRIPPSGHLQTTSKHEEGWASDEYYYVDANGNLQKIRVTARNKGGLIWRGVTGGAERIGREDVMFRQFFVGPEELAQRSPSRSADGYPLYGPVSPAEPQ